MGEREGSGQKSYERPGHILVRFKRREERFAARNSISYHGWRPWWTNPITNRKHAALLLLRRMRAHLGDHMLQGEGELGVDHYLMARSCHPSLGTCHIEPSRIPHACSRGASDKAQKVI